MKYFFIITLISLLFSSSLDSLPKLPKLDLRDNKDKIVFDKVDMNSVIPDPRKDGSNKLTSFRIEEIKNKAKNFEPSKVTKDDVIIISTNKGDMKFKFYTQIAPNTCYNFKKIANSGFYDETLFHRVIKNFIIQGGDILTRDNIPENDGTGGPGWIIDAEISNIKHIKGTLSMNRSVSDINSSGSQFFISVNNNKSLDNNYTVFGYIIEGEYVLDIISKTATEYDQAMMLVEQHIPADADSSRWVEIFDIHTNKIFYSEVPEHLTNQVYKISIENKIKNIYKPGSPVVIKSIRVTNENSEINK